MGIVTLFFNENPMPAVYTKGTIPAKELRLRAALSRVDEVHVISLPGTFIQTPDHSRGALEKKVVVHRTIPWPYYGAGIVHFLYGLYYILTLKPSVLEAESGIISGPAVVLLGKLFGLPTVVELRASYEELIKVHAPLVPYFLKKYLLKKVTQFSYSNATALVANSKTYQRYLKKRGFASVVINPGLQYAPARKPKAPQEKIICYLGRLVEEKGIDDLLQAVSLQKTYLQKHGWKVWIVGSGVRRSLLEQLTYELRLTEMVSFLGSQPNYQTLAKVSLLVNPCYVKHPLEMVNVEAAFMQLPVICYGDTHIPETVQHTITGIHVPYRSVTELAETLQLLCSKPEKRKQMGQAGMRFALENYSFSSQVEELRLLYSRLGLPGFNKNLSRVRGVDA